MKDQLCRAFCDDISIREVPAGLAVSTTFRRNDGDAIAFYVVRDQALPSLARLEDEGDTIPYLEACGVDFSTQTRVKALEALLEEYGAEYDSDEAVVHTPFMREDDLPRAAMRFVALLLRLSDFLLLAQERVESTFKEDAATRIKERIGRRATISENSPVSSRLTESTPDLVLRAKDRPPVAVFLSQTSQHVYEAVLLQMTALYEAHEPLSVVALLETDSSVSRELKKRAMNRLASVTVFKDDMDAAIERIEREVLGNPATYH